MRVISLRMRANKPSSLSPVSKRLEHADFSMPLMEESKIIFYGGIKNDERLFEDVIREGGRRP